MGNGLAWASHSDSFMAVMSHQPDAPTGSLEAESLLGEVQSLAEEAGGPPWFVSNRPSKGVAESVEALSHHLHHYLTETLSRQEWPVIVRARTLTQEGKHQDVVQLDQEWGLKAHQNPFSEASFRVGRRQLSKLRGLRQERVIHHYWKAIEKGTAQGWHPVVFGVVLGVYHLPLRTGLIQFASHSLEGMVTSAERIGRLPAKACQTTLDLAITQLPQLLPPLPNPGEWRCV